ncbi:uncharacterized protein GLRG_05996 [Colletotrichum graminicola M1.001]|uniref:Uncharacterized protein n=1 Tax=Colletotrichum graminicola (strain M1.001 / M2 / FGSC 10212) TaxID=645133 RepID=E3QJ14_COLGM|nr:uncharacterized protein GLRG_05996 [Colletotrichum graminicola M1.001]EFQ30852.1 hypothetical protein GLRG_05996 [Colletotrichum graminicola M1.001]
MEATWGGYKELVWLLLDYGASTDVQDDRGRSALRFAMQKGYDSIAWLLLEKSAALNMADTKGRTALHWTAQNSNTSMAWLLLEKGAEIDAQDIEGHTALHFAVQRGNTEMIKLLLGKHANVTLKDAQGYAALHHAVERKDASIMNLIVDTLERSRLDVNAKDNEGKTALVRAVQGQWMLGVYILTDRKAAIDLPDCNGQTAASHAKLNGDTQILQLLEQR